MKEWCLMSGNGRNKKRAEALLSYFKMDGSHGVVKETGMIFPFIHRCALCAK